MTAPALASTLLALTSAAASQTMSAASTLARESASAHSVASGAFARELQQAKAPAPEAHRQPTSAAAPNPSPAVTAKRNPTTPSTPAKPAQPADNSARSKAEAADADGSANTDKAGSDSSVAESNAGSDGAPTRAGVTKGRLTLLGLEQWLSAGARPGVAAADPGAEGDAGTAAAGRLRKLSDSKADGSTDIAAAILPPWLQTPAAAELAAPAAAATGTDAATAALASTVAETLDPCLAAAADALGTAVPGVEAPDADRTASAGRPAVTAATDLPTTSLGTDALQTLMGGAAQAHAAGADNDRTTLAAAGDSALLSSSSLTAAPQLPAFAAELQRAGLATSTSATAAARAPTELRLSTPVTAPDFVPRLSGELAVLARDGIQEARVQVHPVELGPINVQITLDGSAAQVHMAVDNAQTRDLLEQAMPSLAAALRENGLTLTGGGVSQQSQQNGRDSAGDGSSAGRGKGRGDGVGSADGGGAATTAPQRLQRVGAVDVYA